MEAGDPTMLFCSDGDILVFRIRHQDSKCVWPVVAAISSTGGGGTSSARGWRRDQKPSRSRMNSSKRCTRL